MKLAKIGLAQLVPPILVTCNCQVNKYLKMTSESTYASFCETKKKTPVREKYRTWGWVS
jgi:hypothetical protein